MPNAMHPINGIPDSFVILTNLGFIFSICTISSFILNKGTIKNLINTCDVLYDANKFSEKEDSKNYLIKLEKIRKYVNKTHVAEAINFKTLIDASAYINGKSATLKNKSI